MRRALFFFAAAAQTTGVLATRAHADFRWLGATASGQAVPAVFDVPHVDPGDRGVPLWRRSSSPRQPLRVQGFGNNVPLSFACRQIVPTGIPVIYGRGVDPNTLVTWRGGDPWPVVLSAAVHPLGLRMLQSPQRVVIAQ